MSDLIKPKFTHEYDEDSGLVTFFVDGEEFTCWSCEGEPEDAENEFNRIFMAGFEHAKAQLQATNERLTAERDELKQSFDEFYLCLRHIENAPFDCDGFPSASDQAAWMQNKASEVLNTDYRPLEIRDLKQQAQGIKNWLSSEKVLAKRTKPSNYECGVTDALTNAGWFSDDLIKQAQAKEKG